MPYARSVTLRISCWEHERCLGPMRAAAATWMRDHPATRVVLAARPLAAFNDQPLADLVGGHDLLIVDHPFVGTAAASGALAPVEDWLPAETIGHLRDDAVGPNGTAYVHTGSQWALAVDAACHTSARRDDCFSDLGRPVPTTWTEVRELARELPGRVALPLYPSDAMCSLLTLSAGLGDPVSDDRLGDGAGDAMALLTELVPLLHEGTLGHNPPAVFERMGASDEIMFVPLAFGYTTYARAHARRTPLRFDDVPAFDGAPTGALLGGAGLALSATGAHRAESAAFAAWFASAAVQRDLAFPAGGQPASRTVWDDPLADEAAGGFFSGTRRSMESAYVRPRDAWWPGFQEAAGHLVARALLHREPVSGTVAALAELHTAYRRGVRRTVRRT